VISDALLYLVPPRTPLSLVGALNASFQSQVIDELGTGVGTPPQAIIGTRTLFGADLGIDFYKPQLNVIVGVGAVSAGGGTLNVQFQGAVDTGVGGGYLPGAWITFMETGAIAVANLTAGAKIAMFDWPPAFPVGTLPRYIRLNFVTATAVFTALTISSATVTMIRDDYNAKFAARNYTVA
jgi:hypothetical protein